MPQNFLSRNGILILLACMLLLSACGALFPPKKTTEERIASLPTEHVQLQDEVVIRWNKYMVPYVFANNNHDLAFTLGLLQGHMRGTLVQFLKRIAYGRLGETAGPFTTDIDHLLRLIDFPRAANEVLANMPQDTLDWVDAFVAGFNHAMLMGTTPPDAGIFNLPNEPITRQDVIAMGRVAGADVNWGKYISLLRSRSDDPQNWQTYFADVLTRGYSNTSPTHTETAFIVDLLQAVSRSGSNSIAVAPSRTANNASLLMSDPHLGFLLPNPWFLVGIKSPELHLVGAMLPGLPFIAYGRNKHIAWGGTNMRSASSDLFRLSKEQLTANREITIRNRFWVNKKLTIRESIYGPIISDHPFFPTLDNETLALRWMGHQPSDEITAFLRLNRATNVNEIAQAMQSAAVSGQNIIAVDDQGNIGQIAAVHLPKRRFNTPPDIVLNPTQHDWSGYDDSTTIQANINPPNGYLGSANDQPVWMDTTLGYFMSVPDRPARIAEVMQQQFSWDMHSAKQFQTDAVAPYSRQLAHQIYQQLNQLALSANNQAFIDHFANWDGNYQHDSYAPVAFEITLYYLVESIYSVDDEFPDYVEDYSWLVTQLPKDLTKVIASQNQAQNTMHQVIDKARQQANNIQNWGKMHQLVVAPPYARIPVVGKFFQRYAIPASGSRQTLMKTAHDLVNSKHNASYGSQARHISDMSNLDANYFVLLGGQDGWPQSQNYIDQIPLWEKSEYIQLPLTEQKIAIEFTTWTTVLHPLDSK